MGSLEKPVDDPGCMETCHDILWKASPRLEETDGDFKTQGLPAQPQVIMGSGLGGQRSDSGQAVLADVEERWIGWAPTGIQRDPLKDHVLIIRSSSTLKCEDKHGGDQILWGTCAKLCRVLKPNRLAVSTVMVNLSQRN